MKVSEQSWHFQWARWFYGWYYEPRNLCFYFWSVVFAVGAPITLGALLGAAAVVIIAALVVAVHQHPLVLAIAVGIGLASGTLYFLLSSALCRWRAFRDRAAQRPPVVREPNLVVAYLRAKKRRLCPLIEVVP